MQGVCVCKCVVCGCMGIGAPTHEHITLKHSNAYHDLQACFQGECEFAQSLRTTKGQSPFRCLGRAGICGVNTEVDSSCKPQLVRLAGSATATAARSSCVCFAKSCVCATNPLRNQNKRHQQLPHFFLCSDKKSNKANVTTAFLACPNPCAKFAADLDNLTTNRPLTDVCER